MLVKISEKYPDDLNVLIMRSAAIAGTGRLYAARKLLEQAVKAHPQSFLPHYNLAYVTLELGEGRNAAKLHYERGRELGGPVNEDLERRLKND
jgi:Flp pilus assembly protein TadD